MKDMPNSKAEDLKGVMNELSLIMEEFNKRFEKYRNHVPEGSPGSSKEVV